MEAIERHIRRNIRVPPVLYIVSLPPPTAIGFKSLSRLLAGREFTAGETGVAANLSSRLGEVHGAKRPPLRAPAGECAACSCVLADTLETDDTGSWGREG